MPFRFPTEAANDPVVSADDVPRGRVDSAGRPDRRRSDVRTNDSKPGKDINQAGFIRERDKDQGDRER